MKGRDVVGWRMERLAAGGGRYPAADGQSSYGVGLPSYRELVGVGDHAGFHEPAGPLAPQDQLHLERLVAESAAIDTTSAVLDAGCGNGAAACHVARLTGARVRGLTSSATQLERARSTAESQGVAGRVRFDLGDPLEMPYPDASFDAVLFFASPSRLPDRRRYLAEAWRVLRPGGRLAGEDWLAGEGIPAELRDHWTGRIASAWAIPLLDTLSAHEHALAEAGFEVQLARDLREDMDLDRGLLVDAAAREQLRAEVAQAGDPVRRVLMEGALVLGEAAACGAFTVGRFLARKPPAG